jgi:hypothetical protein
VQQTRHPKEGGDVPILENELLALAQASMMCFDGGSTNFHAVHRFRSGRKAAREKRHERADAQEEMISEGRHTIEKLDEVIKK